MCGPHHIHFKPKDLTILVNNDKPEVIKYGKNSYKLTFIWCLQMLYIFDPQTILQILKSNSSDGLKLCDGRGR